MALATCAVRSLRGEDTTVGQGLSAAMQRIGPIVGWSLVAATVGLIIVAIIVIGGGGAFALFAAGMTPIAFAVATVFVAAAVVVAIISSALSEIFRVAVYQYAVTGVAPAAFDSHLVQTAFDGRTPRA